MTARPALAASLALGALLTGCGLMPQFGNDRIHVLNNTTIALTLVVNDRQIAVVEPGANADVGPAELGPMPWHAEVRTMHGRELMSIDVAVGSVQDVRNLDGTGSYSAPATRIDLSCGQVRLYAGRLGRGGPPPGPGTPGDCDP